LLFADSKNRDYPSGNSYVLHLTRPIKNIERVDLVSARVPNKSGEGALLPTGWSPWSSTVPLSGT
jgi:hypothetical protein